MKMAIAIEPFPARDIIRRIENIYGQAQYGGGAEKEGAAIFRAPPVDPPPKPVKSRPSRQRGRLAQLVEHLVYTVMSRTRENRRKLTLVARPGS